ncbi:ABC transporter permease [Rouxiella badensis]|jgi:peptide/nickel transport system permease protein|uniref:Peptide ABC transporter permease n=1 Tax=Rouxiella badensis TaxID=1646377 RepID=A0A1X0WG11_9GAMM|nr:ABC transporter permease [Rouxiella badensis]MCC3705053.1 ABC transporter permease [Rouxiella badensis]MCC3735311.1 ABC transporter permease [Rouxiella badensis]MCC3746365.1 ABC transporter permease [Rouxiella badensis]MCC3760608.1 ABC transporter permease [Rouxiella badensis]ORJ25684.1 peptide ABC transporter permease [Rouxiella badensis]
MTDKTWVSDNPIDKINRPSLRLPRLVKRVLMSVAVLWAAYTLTFLILYILPSDPVTIMLNQGEQSTVDIAQVNALKAQYHLDQPFYVQYAWAIWDLLHLNLGHSIVSGDPVTRLVMQALPPTLLLAVCALAVAIVIGGGLAAGVSVLPAGRIKSALLTLPSLGAALPTFWLGLLLLQAFSFTRPWFPAMGNHGWQSLVLPTLTLAVPTAATLAQVMSRSLAEVWRRPFIDALRLKGASTAHLLWRHVLPNAAVPLLTLTGMIFGHLLAGAVVTETIFSREGLGRLAQGAVSTQDIPVVQGVVLTAATVFVLVNFVVDLLYPLLDPRIDSGSAGGGK